MRIKKKKQTDYLYNEHDINQVQMMRKKIKKKKKKRRQRFVLAVIVIVFIICFFNSDMSKIQSISINGCQRLTEDFIIENISIKAHSTYIFDADKKALQNEVEDLIFVKKATVSRSFYGKMNIHIEENEPITYCYIQNILYVVDEKGSIQEDKEQKWLSYVQRTPQSMNFDLKSFQSFVKEYTKLPSDVRNQISSIIFEPNEKDTTKCKLELDDGKIFYVRIENMAKQLTSSHYYLVIQKYPDYKYYDFLGRNVYVYNE
ncbi:MAG: cell division protein FtsQ/DivIB [Faecalibacillus sp.]